MKERLPRVLLIGLLAGLVVAFFAFRLDRYLSLDYLKAQQDSFRAFYTANVSLTLGIFFVVYVLTTALSLPGAALLTLAGGALFGVVVATVVVSFASTLGGLLSFLSARYLFRDAVQRRFGSKLVAINEGFRKDGAFYLFSLRLIPAFPFFLVNLAMGLVPIRPFQFCWVSQLGMLPGTIVYANAGTQLSRISSLQGILTPPIVLSLLALAIFPFVVKKALSSFR